MELDIAANRAAANYTRQEYIKRILWSVAIYIFKCTPRNAFTFRNGLLRLFGAKIGRGVHIYNSAIIYYPWNLEIDDMSSIGEWALIYNLGTVRIGKKSTISHKSHVCAGTHDYTSPDLPLIKKEINIADQVWVCAEAFISPGIKIATGAVIGARSVVTKDVANWIVVAGNPAKFIRARTLNPNS